MFLDFLKKICGIEIMFSENYGLYVINTKVHYNLRIDKLSSNSWVSLKLVHIEFYKGL